MDIILSIVVLAALALTGGGIFLWRRGNRKQAGLMLLLAMVMIGNVLIWTVPGADGMAPLDHAAAAK